MPHFQGRIDSKLPHVGTTIFTVMSRLAQEHDAINLSQGFPDFDCSRALRDLFTKAVHSGLNQYPPMAGIPVLRERIAEKMQALYGTAYDPEHEITVVPGATYGIFTAIAAFIRPGDEVILFEPAYDSYEPGVSTAGGKAVFVPLVLPDYHVDWDKVQKAITPRTRMIILNSPHNPTATVLSAEDMRMLESVLRATDIVVVSDEVYEHIVFDGHKHQSVASFPGLAERSFVVSSFGKTYHVTGWKMGYVLAPKELTAEFRKVHQFTTFAVVTPIQHALADFMAARPEHFEQLPAFYQAKRDRFCELLANSRFRFRPAAGTFFQVLDYSEISAEADVDIARRLTEEIRVASIPISVFCESPFPERQLRFCFAKDDETLVEAAERLSRL